MSVNKIYFHKSGPNRIVVKNICQELIDEAVTSVYTLAGSITFDELPELSAEYLGFVYEITEDFTTTSDFVEGAGKTFPASTNVTIVNRGTTDSPVYMYDASIGDLSSFQTRKMDITVGNETTVEGAIEYLDENKVDVESGKGLSTNDFTDEEQTKLSGIETGAEVNVQPDWDQTDTTADDYINNKPTAVSEFTNDSGFIDKDVSNLTYYYTKEEIDALIAGVLELNAGE